MIAHAQAVEAAARSVVGRLNDAIIFPLITLMSSVAVVLFLWGAFQFILNAESDEARKTGKRHMFWGVIGLFVMMTAYALLRVAAGSVGLGIPV